MRILKNELLASMDVHHTYECYYQFSTESIVTVRCADLMDSEDIYSTGIDIVIGETPELHIKPIARKSIIIYPFDYVEIPGRYHIYVEKSMMNHFCKSIEDGNISDSLLFILKHRNKSNAGKFMQTLKALNLENRLIPFKESFYLSIALDWCKANNIEMTK
ncbi:MAG: hypothetical protein FIA99_11210 [Ruminiclostridium sp.]|nr:hypothetical protein [Ruminiclostridium sp.]